MRLKNLTLAVVLWASLPEALRAALEPMPTRDLTAAIAADRFSKFVRARSERLDGYAEPKSAAAGSLPRILAAREHALDQLEAFYGAKLGRRLALVFFANEESKLKATGHRGWGWAVNDVIVEVNNDKIHLEPYHELSHMVSARLGAPPALFDEGAAVYVAKRFGGDPMGEFGHPGASLDAVVALNIDAGHYVPMREVFAFSEIGPPRTQGEFSYPEAASFVSFLVLRFGEAALRTAFGRLRSSDDSRQIAANALAFREIFGVDVEMAERSWRRQIGRPLEHR